MADAYRQNTDFTAATQVTTPGNKTAFIPQFQTVSGAIAPAVPATSGTAIDVSSYGSVSLQVHGLSGGDTLAVTKQTDGTNFSPISGISEADYSVVATISADGIYDYPGGGLIKYTKTGSASTPTVSLRAGS